MNETKRTVIIKRSRNVVVFDCSKISEIVARSFLELEAEQESFTTLSKIFYNSVRHHVHDLKQRLTTLLLILADHIERLFSSSRKRKRTENTIFGYIDPFYTAKLLIICARSFIGFSSYSPEIRKTYLLRPQDRGGYSHADFSMSAFSAVY